MMWARSVGSASIQVSHTYFVAFNKQDVAKARVEIAAEIAPLGFTCEYLPIDQRKVAA